MNLQTYGKRLPKMADNRAACLVLYSALMAEYCGLARFTPENSPRITALSGVQWKTFGHSRVKREANYTPETLKRSAQIALENASEWVRTAESLIAKAHDLEATP